MPRPLGLIPDTVDLTNDLTTDLWLAGWLRLEAGENLVIDMNKLSDEGDEESLQALRSQVWQAIVHADANGHATINTTTPDVTGSLDITHPDGIDKYSGGQSTGSDVLARRPGLPGYSVPLNGGPQIVTLSVPSGSAYIDIDFTEGVYQEDGETPIAAADLELELITASGVTVASISSVKQNDSATEGSASALVGGETTVRVFLTLTGTPDGGETVGINPASAAIADAEGNLAVEVQKTVDLVA